MGAKEFKTIKFVKSDQPAEAAANLLSFQIQSHLDEQQPVSWFLSGGSAIEVAVLAAKKLAGSLSNLTVTLVDERYGPTGHQNSNWQQLIEAGFSLPAANLYPILKGHDVNDTAKEFSLLTSKILAMPSYKIALLGMGTDGHTAGILPNSPAVTSTDLVNYYHTPEFDRLTLTPRALARLDEAVVYAQGLSKHPALRSLSKEISLDNQPAQILKKIPRVTIFNDLRGDKDETSN